MRRWRWRGESGERAGPEVGEKRVQGDNVVERCRKEGSRANKRDMTVSALRLSVLHPSAAGLWRETEDRERIARRSRSSGSHSQKK